MPMTSGMAARGKAMSSIVSKYPKRSIAAGITGAAVIGGLAKRRGRGVSKTVGRPTGIYKY